jgi:L-ascorbate metabolism protein UlaG (beta-lactamase superfamily)
MTQPTLEFVGTATTVLRLGAFTVLTDPNFLHRGQRAYLGRGLWSKRRTEPSLQPAELPALHAVGLSHLHGDHFDRIARDQLDHELPILTTRHAARNLGKWGFRSAHGMSTWESVELQEGSERLRLTSAPGQHAPGPLQRVLPEVMGTVYELDQGDGGPPFRLYISGDTLYFPWLREVVERTGPLDAAVLHLGGTKILGVLVTMDGDQGAQLMDLLSPRVTVPIHYDDYGVFHSPLSDFIDACRRRHLDDGVRPVYRGETVALR